MSGSAEPLVDVELLSSIARADGAAYAGSIMTVRADVAAAWIAAGLARAVVPSSGAAPETTMRERARGRQAPR